MDDIPKKLVVVGDRILVAPEEGEERTSVGLYLPPTAVDRQAVQGGRIVAEGRPDGPLQPRSRCIEALDPVSLEVRRSVAVADVIVDLLVDGSQVWILRADGVVASYDGPSLRPLGETRTRGSGPGFLAAWGGALWSLGADQAAGTTTVLTRIARDTQAATIEVRFPGRFPAALSRTASGGSTSRAEHSSGSSSPRSSSSWKACP